VTTSQYTSLIVQLEARFSELDIFCNELPTWVLRDILRGDLMLVVVYFPWCGYTAIKWCRATEMPLGELFSGNDAS